MKYVLLGGLIGLSLTIWSMQMKIKEINSHVEVAGQVLKTINYRLDIITEEVHYGQ